VRQTTNVYDVSARKPKGTRPFEIPRRERELSIEFDLEETGQEVVDWIRLAE
jgi:hypothetical protein